MSDDRSSNIVELKNLRDRVDDRKADVERSEGPLKGGGGGGTFSGMDTHVSDARVAIATLTERIGHLPTKGYIGTLIAAWAAAIITALTLLSRFGWLVPGPPTH